MATRIQVTIDCADPDRLARFWTAALGYELAKPPDGSESWQAYWVGRGLAAEEIEDGYFAIVDPAGMGPRIWFQPVPNARWSRTGSTSTWVSAVAVRSRWRPGGSGWTPRRTGWSAPARPGCACSRRKAWTTTPW